MTKIDEQKKHMHMLTGVRYPRRKDDELLPEVEVQSTTVENLTEVAKFG